MALIAKRMCLRYATQPTEGYGWSEYYGADWVQPVPNIGALGIIDTNNVNRMLVLDRNDNDFWEVGTCNRQTVMKPSPLDKETTEVEWQKWGAGKTVSPADEEDKVEHAVSHVFVRPDDPENRGQTGYTATGLRSAQELSIDAFMDGELVTVGATTIFPENGDIVFSGRKVEARQVQLRTCGTAGEIRVVGQVDEFIGKPKAGNRSERTMSDHGYQDDLSQNLELWIDRFCTKQFYDKVAKATLAGTGTRLTGPDGRANSGITLGANLNLGNAAIAGNYTIMVWSNNTALIGGITLTAVGAVTGGWQAYYATGAALAANLVAATGMRFYGLRIYSDAISVEAITAWRDDVVANEAKGYGGW
jgi:hypothetical protein